MARPRTNNEALRLRNSRWRRKSNDPLKEFFAKYTESHLEQLFSGTGDADSFGTEPKQNSTDIWPGRARYDDAIMVEMWRCWKKHGPALKIEHARRRLQRRKGLLVPWAVYVFELGIEPREFDEEDRTETHLLRHFGIADEIRALYVEADPTKGGPFIDKALK